MGKSDMIECPRCLGKGYVDGRDIKRLMMKTEWSPGKCLYCDGGGKVPRNYLDTKPITDANTEPIGGGCLGILLLCGFLLVGAATAVMPL